NKNYDESYDDKLGGWGEGQKYMDADSLDLAIARAEAGDVKAAERARQTLDAAIALIDPVWGGVFQYSERGSWTHPHFEKIMQFQAQYLRQYSWPMHSGKNRDILPPRGTSNVISCRSCTIRTARFMLARMPISITTRTVTNITPFPTKPAAS